MVGGNVSLKQTPTWAVAIVFFVLVAISIGLEHVIHLISKGQRVDVVGFLSLLLIGGEGLISTICISKTMGSTWHPCFSISIGLEHVIHLIAKGQRVDVIGVLILAPNRRRRSNFSNLHIRDHGVDVASLLEETKGGADYGVRLQRKGNSPEAFGGGGFN
ncbi:hypothetical protein RHSIM_Rhsim02G0224700 [Rhododendron simsii]|uniref:Uncharacterized protein n=1 Tax=Rhododendron simsii TaxID=118357 RepID=A0A834LUN7_RHOSS|nr:hypothetical protein RHSIM_Rhsim02G0224700 [Rhododendron simsii]